MADFAIGDRVEVRWQAALFDAEVIHVHSPGKVDVVYDFDGSVGIFLTVEEHGLKLVGDEEKKGGGGGKKKKVCSVGGCSNNVHSRGLCPHHGRKPCSVDGCSTKAHARGLCWKHGALGECLREGCTSAARNKGRLCSKHTVKLSCADPDCDTPQVLGKFVCIKHGAYGYCTTDACISNAISSRGKCTKHDSKTCSADGCSTDASGRGLCKKHGGRGFCSFNKCTSAVQARGRCAKHGGGRKKMCKEEGCATLAKARGVCAKHGAHGTCTIEGCATNAQSTSAHCRKHGGGNQKPCSVAGCTTTSQRKGLCHKHGGGPGECVFGGCTNQMVGSMWKTCVTHGGLGHCAYTEEGGDDVLAGKCLTPAIKSGGNCRKHTSK